MNYLLPHKIKCFSIGKIIEILFLALLLIGFVAVGIAVFSGEWQIRPILSGSMEPGFSVGGVAITERIPISQLKVGDVADFHPPGIKNTSYIHRVIKITHSGKQVIINTKGDMNTTPDPWTLKINSKYAYIAKYTVPFIGYAAVWLHSPSGRRYTLTLAVFLALIYIGYLTYEFVKKQKTKERI